MSSKDFLKQRLEQRRGEGLLRGLRDPDGRLADLTSNDYLGVVKDNLLGVSKESLRSGSTGSRLLTGHSGELEVTEVQIADFHGEEAALLFSSGYAANLGMISALGRGNDFLLYDELSHASVYDGVRLSRATTFPFRHNDLEHLEARLKYGNSKRNGDSQCFVLVESIYSMDGDFAPLKSIQGLCERYDAHLIVDEAHATGVYGDKGSGLVNEAGLQGKVFARMHTFGKALGCHGAAVIGSAELKKYLLNFSRAQIYSTALSSQSAKLISRAYDLIIKLDDNRFKINNLINLFKSKIEDIGFTGFLPVSGQIQSYIVPGNDAARSLSEQLKNYGLDVRPILSPTVPKGTERLRICLHSFNTEKELDLLFEALMAHQNKYSAVSSNSL